MNRLSPHISRHLGSELDEVRQNVLAMGGLVEEQLVAALRGLVNGSVSSASEVSDREALINAADVDIDGQCAQIIARRQPAASDLRLVLTIMKMVGDMERIGDEAKRIGRLADKVVDSEGADDTSVALAGLGENVRDMLRSSLDAFARLDPEQALVVMRRDRAVDATYRETLATITARMQSQPERIPTELDRLWAARSLERIGDHCKNLCEYVIYLVNGKDVRHTGLAKPPAG
ncbi:MAG: phosphate signaling complex protein PhoU [Dokdonella sp.]